MTTEAILETVASAARSRRTVAVSLRTEEGNTEAEVEPYSIVRRRREPTLFFWDVRQGRVVGVPVDALVEATATERVFSPRYEVEF